MAIPLKERDGSGNEREEYEHVSQLTALIFGRQCSSQQKHGTQASHL
jgi:hypothetical protein